VEEHAGDILLALFFVPENGGGMFFRNVGWLWTYYMELCPRSRAFHNHRCENLNHNPTLLSNPTHGKYICPHYFCVSIVECNQRAWAGQVTMQLVLPIFGSIQNFRS
jgi:hypothetical protein